MSIAKDYDYLYKFVNTKPFLALGMAPTKIIGFARLRQGLTSWDGYEKDRVEKLDEKLVVWHNLGRPTPRSLIIQLGKSRGRLNLSPYARFSFCFLEKAQKRLP